MKRIFLTSVLFLGVAFLSFAQIAPAAMTLTTNAFADGTIIPVKYSQAAPGAAPGEGTSPALSWGNIPAGTKSLLLHMHDLDFVRNKTTDDQVHWLVWNIPANATVVVYCSVGVRSEKIGEKLIAAGYKNVLNLYGGIFEWVNQNLPVYKQNGVQTAEIHTYDNNWERWAERGTRVN
jgi:phosphatidylethanolamine-binding protein (PEBP) family uncharacterized protein